MSTPLERLVGPLPSAPTDFRDHSDMVSQAVFDASKRDVDAFVRVLEEEPTLLESGTVVFALGAVDDARLVPLLVGVLKNGDSSVRWSAAHALEKRRDARVTDAFIDALHDRAPSVRAVVIEALGEFADPRALPALRDALSRPSNHNDDYLRKLLEAAIEKLHP
jgi:HEAT repeat protein